MIFVTYKSDVHPFHRYRNEWLPAVMGTRATARWATTGCSVRETVDPLDGDQVAVDDVYHPERTDTQPVIITSVKRIRG